MFRENKDRVAIELFDFPPVSKEKWIEKITKDLKGASFEESLTFKLPGGIVLNALYHADDVNINDSTPGVAPYHRGNKKESNAFKNRQFFDLESKNVNNEILTALNQNVNSILLTGSNLEGGLKDVEPTWIDVSYIGSEIDAFIDYCVSYNKKNFQIETDPFLTNRSNWIKEATDLKKQHPEAFFIAINAVGIANSGGSQITELLYALCAGHEAIVQMMENGLTIDEASANLVFNFGLGPLFYVETAKLRAFRILWSTIIEQYNPEHNCSFNCTINAETVSWNKPSTGKEINMLRSTTESMSGIIGGADSILVNHINLSSQSETFNRRMAVNILNLLSEESYMELVVDPAGGSYVIESLTNQMADKVWEQFKEIESKGGLTKNSDTINIRMEKERKELMEQIKDGKIVLTGTNKYRKERGDFNINDLNFSDIRVL